MFGRANECVCVGLDAGWQGHKMWCVLLLGEAKQMKVLVTSIYCNAIHCVQHFLNEMPLVQHVVQSFCHFLKFAVLEHVHCTAVLDRSGSSSSSGSAGSTRTSIFCCQKLELQPALFVWRPPSFHIIDGGGTHQQPILLYLFHKAEIQMKWSVCIRYTNLLANNCSWSFAFSLDKEICTQPHDVFVLYSKLWDFFKSCGSLHVLCQVFTSPDCFQQHVSQSSRFLQTPLLVM